MPVLPYFLHLSLFFILAPQATSAENDEAVKAKHWAFQTPKRAAFPAVKNEGWVRQPIDRFVLAKLEKEGLKPSTEADSITLLRRVTLDLIGLPPTPEEVAVFLKESAIDRSEKRTKQWLSGCLLHPIMANAGPASGSTPPAMPTPMGSKKTNPPGVDLSRLGHRRDQPRPAL